MRIYLAEDEPLAAQKLMLFLQKLGESADDLHHFGDGAALLEALRHQPLPDLIFLDIEMPRLTGIEVLSQLQRSQGEQAPKVIITSAYERYAIDGFNFGVADYLLKPYTLERLRQALAKVRPEPTIDLRINGRSERIRIADILCMEADRDYTTFCLVDGRRLTSLGTLSSYEQLLPAGAFVRVQRSFIIALRHIVAYSSTQVELPGDIIVPVGKTYRDSFAALMRPTER